MEKSRKINPGDLLPESGDIVVKELTFKEWIDRMDDHMLEYDLEGAWDHWQENGPLIEVLDSKGALRCEWIK